MKITNLEICKLFSEIKKSFENNNSINLPIKVNFFFIKNKNILFKLYEEIEKARLDLLKRYAVIDNKTEEFYIPSESVQAANKAINELFSIEQEVEIYKVKLKDFKEDLILTTEQMEALMFMIEE